MAKIIKSLTVEWLWEDQYEAERLIGFSVAVAPTATTIANVDGEAVAIKFVRGSYHEISFNDVLLEKDAYYKVWVRTEFTGGTSAWIASNPFQATDATGVITVAYQSVVDGLDADDIAESATKKWAGQSGADVTSKSQAMANLISRGAGYHFDGTADIEVSNDPNLNVGIGDFSISVLGFIPNNVTQTECLVTKYAGGTGYGLYKTGDDLYIYIDAGTTYIFAKIGANVFTANTIYNITVTFDRSANATAYINGVSITDRTIAISTVNKTLDNAGNFMIGSDSGGGLYLGGKIGAVSINNLLLTETEVYVIHSGASVDYKYLGASQTELMPNKVDRDFSAASAWADIDLVSGGGSYSDHTDLTITAGAIGDYCTLPVASAPTTIGKRYRMTFDISYIVSSWTIESYNGNQTIGIVDDDGTQIAIEWTAETTGGYRIVSVADDSAGNFDNFTLTQIGQVANYEPEGIESDIWKDSSGNNLHADATHATAINVPFTQDKLEGIEADADVTATYLAANNYHKIFTSSTAPTTTDNPSVGDLWITGRVMKVCTSVTGTPVWECIDAGI